MHKTINNIGFEVFVYKYDIIMHCDGKPENLAIHAMYQPPTISKIRKDFEETLRDDLLKKQQVPKDLSFDELRIKSINLQDFDGESFIYYIEAQFII